MAGRDNARQRRLAVMSPPPAKPFYCPPPPEECDEWPSLPMDIAEGVRIYARAMIYRSKIVDFAIVHEVREDGLWSQISRIDCCHSEVHEHLFAKSTGRDVNRKVHFIIPGDNDQASWDVVDNAYTVLYDTWIEDAEERERYWRTT